jgi:hypothetical protein
MQFIFNFIFRYILFLINQSVQYEDSGMDPKVKSSLTLVSVQTSSITDRLETVEGNLAEISVRQSEEQDGRINEGYFLCIQSQLFIVSVILL